MTPLDNIGAKVAESGLCSGCGVCAGLCPTSALQMRVNHFGDLTPEFHGACLKKCNICLSICPFAKGLYDPRPLNTTLYAGTDGQSRFHENLGWYRSCVVGHSASPASRLRAASGGLATWCLQTALRRGLVDRVAVVHFERNRDGGGLFRFASTNDPDAIAQASGSVYHPVEITQVVREVLGTSAHRWALIGVPCLCAAIRRSHKLSARVPLLFGLACGMYQNTMYTEFLLARSGVKVQELDHAVYREKVEGQPAANFAFRAYARNGTPGRPVLYHGTPYFLGRHAHFRLKACDYCTDVFAETADATFLDAWLPPYDRDFRGTSLVVIRSGAAQRILRAGLNSGELRLAELPADSVAASQATHIRRKQDLIGLRCTTAPRRGIGRPPRASEKIDWALQRLTRAASRRAWAALGRYGTRAYWLAMAPLACASFAFDKCQLMSSLVSRALKKQ